MSLSHQRRQGDGTVDGQQLEELKKLNKSELYKLAKEFAPDLSLTPVTKTFYIGFNQNAESVLNFDGRYFGYFYCSLSLMRTGNSNNSYKSSVGRVYDGNSVVSELTRMVHGDDILSWANVNNHFLGFGTAMILSRFDSQINQHSFHVQFIGYKLGDSEPNPEVPQPQPFGGVLLGDSTIAEYACGTLDVGDAILTASDLARGSSIQNNAVPAHTIAQQKDIFLGDENKANYSWYIVQVGLNDLDPSESIAVTMARYQDLVDTINLHRNPSSVLILSAIIPCKFRLIYLYGEVDGLVAYDKYLAFNNAVMGIGVNAINSVDYRVNTHIALLDDGSGNLKPEFDCGDGVHENNAARQIIGNSLRTQLSAAGF